MVSPELLHLILRDRVVVVLVDDRVIVVVIIVVGLIVMDGLQKLRRRWQTLALMDPVQAVCVVGSEEGLMGMLLLLMLLVLLLLAEPVDVSGQVLQVVNHLLQGHTNGQDRRRRHRVEQLVGGVPGG